MKRVALITLTALLIASLGIMVLPTQPAKAEQSVWTVNPGESIQEAIDAAIEAGGGTVNLIQGIYYRGEPDTILYIAPPEYHGQDPDHDVSHLNIIGIGATLDDLSAWHKGETVSGSVLESPIFIYEADYEIKVQGLGLFGKELDHIYAAIYVENSNPVISDCVVHYGKESGNGGGMVNLDSSPTVNNTIFFDCYVGSKSGERTCGGAMYNDDASPTLYNCMFLYNSATNYNPGGLDLPGGGAIANKDSSVTLINCTLGYNFTSELGGGIYNDGGSSSTLVNCIMWGNRKGELHGEKVLDNIYGDATVTYSDIEGGWGGEGNIDEEPMFVDTEWGEPEDWLVDFRLLPDSPCIDIGNNEAVLGLLDKDFEGDPRIYNDIVDMGADEYVPETELVTATVDIKPDTLNLKSKGKWVTVYIELPTGYDVGDIDVSTVKLEGTVSPEPKPTELGDYDTDGIADLMVKFDRAAVATAVEVGEETELVVSGEVAGTPFEGSDTIRVK